MINELVNNLRKESKQMSEYGVNYMATLLTRAADTIELLSERSSADRPSGTYTNSDYNHEWYAIEATCNLCGERWMGSRNFCPNCGAQMKGTNDEQ